MSACSDAATALAIWLAAVAPATAWTVPVDVAIVLAVDNSKSIDEGELGVERAGYIAALTHPDLIRAIRLGRRGRIALAYFEFARDVLRPTEISWRVIDSAEAAQAMAQEIAALPVRPDYGTSLSRAIGRAVELIADGLVSGERRIIDVLGDGPNNAGPPIDTARARAVAAGITVNGLPLLLRPSGAGPATDRYFEACVIGGPGAFIFPVYDAAGLAGAIRRKLVLEISAAPAPARLLAAADLPVDCMIGERLRDAGPGAMYPGLYR